MGVREKAENEKRLIDANDIYPLFDKSGFARLHVADIDTIPRVDAVDVVRCKDCKHRYSDSWCEYVDDDDNFYCARGERKDGDER